MTTETTDLFDIIVTDAMLDNGASPAVLASRGPVVRGKKLKEGVTVSKNQIRWTEEEDQFLRDCLGKMPLKEIAQSVGRSENALKIRYTRMGYKSPTKIAGWVTSHKACRLLGVDNHAVPNWFRLGMIPGRYAYTSNRDIIMISLADLKFWATRPQHWPYFKVERMPPGHLRRLVEKAQDRWGDEWLTTAQVAEMKGLPCAKTVLTDIKHGNVPAIQCRHIGGRDEGSWAYWFIRKSDALAYKHPTRASSSTKPWYTDRADAFLRQLVAEGKTAPQAARLMKQNERYLSSRMSKIRKEQL